jgi:cell division protein FtsB
VPPAARRSGHPTRERLRRVFWVVVSVAALWFAIQGGEYSTVDLIRQHRARLQLTHEIDSLRHIVDSLARYKVLVLRDPKTQERIAREEFGMVRDKELLYRFAPPDSR